MKRLRDLLVESKNTRTRTYTITADVDTLNTLEKVLAVASMLGKAGAGREIKFYMDGDGHDRPHIEELEDRKFEDHEDDWMDDDVIDVSYLRFR